MTESNTEFVQGLYEASPRGDTEAGFAALSDDIEWHEAEGGPCGGVHRGPDEVRPGSSARSRRAFRTLRFGRAGAPVGERRGSWRARSGMGLGTGRPRRRKAGVR